MMLTLSVAVIFRDQIGFLKFMLSIREILYLYSLVLNWPTMALDELRSLIAVCDSGNVDDIVQLSRI